MPPKTEPHIQALPATIPFIAPEKFEREQKFRFKARLGANEGNFGCSPRAIAAIADAATHDIGNYCDPECFELRQALAAHLDIDMDNIVVGSGIDGLLGLIVRLFSAPNDVILTSLGAYPTFNYHVAAYNRQLKTVPYALDKEDLTGLLETAQSVKPAIIYLSNPDNPMGTWWSASEIETFIKAVPPDTLIILDEAYCELAPQSALPEIDVARENLLRLRTFSKAYGLAGLRCGYAFGHKDLITPFEKVRDHFGVNIMAQKAALAALDDQTWLQNAIERNASARDRIAQIAKHHGFNPIPSATNFVTMDCGADGALALDVLHHLHRAGIFIRKPMAPILDRCIRVSCGTQEELAHFERALSTFKPI